MIPVKTAEELELMRRAGAILAKILRQVRQKVTAGITTAAIDEAASALIEAEGVRAAFKGYRGYPASVCVSVNEEIVHGIPGTRVLKRGDIVSVDIGIEYGGFFADAAVTIPLGEVDSRVKKLLEVTKSALACGIRQAREGNRLGDISYAVQTCVEQNGFSVVRQFVGHGIGRQLHEDPEVPNFGRPHRGPELKNGMVLAIEPMVNIGGWEAEVLENGWTTVTADRTPSAHFEHTVAITAQGPQILTA